MDLTRSWLRPRAPQSALSPDREHVKLAEVVAADLYADILARGWPVGAVLASEWDLIARHNVSRAVLREAVRLLEHHRIAEMRRGRGGGLVVTHPDRQACTETTALYLASQGADLTTVHATRKAIEIACLDLVMARGDDVVATLRHTVQAEPIRYDAGHDAHDCDLHAAIADLCGNPVLGLFSRVLSSVYAQAVGVQQDPFDWPAASESITKAHERILRGIEDGDPDVARRRMTRHLDVIHSWFDRPA
jgi:DNA-binding FadR family transcriptional regulator